VSRHWRVAVACERGVALTALLCVLSLCAHAATPAPCARIETAPRALPDPAVCLRRADIDTPATAVDSEANAARLFAHAENRIAAGRFDEAEHTLDCAQAVLGEHGDANADYELIRRRGILDYRRERIPEALKRFECALELSTAREDRAAIARDLKNVGTSLRRLGDFRGALRELTRSLEMQRSGGDVGGAVLNNIADVYRELGEPVDAMRYYLDASEAFRAHGDRTEAAHVLESMGELELDRGDADEATRRFEQALRGYRDSGDRSYALRVYGGLIRAALAHGDVAKANEWRASALAIVGAHGLTLPAPVQLQIARTERLSGHLDAASVRIRNALAGLPQGAAERGPLREELAAIQEASGDRASAIASLRLANADALASARAQEDRQLGWLRTRFETAERDRTIATLESENRLRRAELRQRTLLLWLMVAIASAIALGAWSLLQRRRQRERLLEEARRIRQEQELARYRREADALAEDRSLLQALLDSREDAVCLLDAEGHVLAANRTACRLLGAGEQALPGHTIVGLLVDDDCDALISALERMEDVAVQTLDVSARGGGALRARLAQWERGDGLIVLGLQERPDTATEATVSHAARDGSAGEAGMRTEFRRTLVELMLAVVDSWERSTGTSRLELAEKSRIWRVNIDDGRLRARAMERYLTVSKLPHNPRWRDVLRSAYFVLGQCDMSAETRSSLQGGVDAVLAYTRRSALV
jgi:two-component system, sensor histidine kinase ChiS